MITDPRNTRLIRKYYEQICANKFDKLDEIQKFHDTHKLLKLTPGVLLWCSGLRIWGCRCCGLGHCHGSGSIPGPGNSHMPWAGAKKKGVLKKKLTWITQIVLYLLNKLNLYLKTLPQKPSRPGLFTGEFYKEITPTLHHLLQKIGAEVNFPISVTNMTD